MILQALGDRQQDRPEFVRRRDRSRTACRSATVPGAFPGYFFISLEHRDGFRRVGHASDEASRNPSMPLKRLDLIGRHDAIGEIEQRDRQPVVVRRMHADVIRAKHRGAALGRLEIAEHFAGGEVMHRARQIAVAAERHHERHAIADRVAAGGDDRQAAGKADADDADLAVGAELRLLARPRAPRLRSMSVTAGVILNRCRSGAATVSTPYPVAARSSARPTSRDSLMPSRCTPGIRSSVRRVCRAGR